MRELALITLRIVDETVRLQPEELISLYTPDYADSIIAESHMERLERPAPVPGAVEATSDGMLQFRPTAEMTLIRVEPCNPDSALGALLARDEIGTVRQFIGKLGNAGLKLLDRDNDERDRLDGMSRTLGGEGVDQTDMVQFYAVFTVTGVNDLQAVLEGVLRLDKIDFAIDEAILLA